MQRFDSRTIFFLGLLLAASGIVSAPFALAGGILFGFTVEHPFRPESHSLAKLLLQISVVALGFGMNLHQVLHAGRSGFLYTAISITCAIALGLLFGRLLHVGGKASFLITIGTAICGGSAIAALAPITDANEEEISVSMGTVFVLNSIALLIFPAIGAALHLDQNQFGLWAALAIHDTSSVVGAAAKYGEQALAIGTAVKLARALWIVPLALIVAGFMRAWRPGAGSGTGSVSGPGAAPKVAVPWFIFLFCLATAVRTYLPRFATEYAALSHLGKSGLTATLFLIGTSLSARTLRQVGARPFLQGIGLWIIVATVSLVAIYYRWIAI
jgi:uncharacterized integral membrane protein (TIGR00698 family)